MVTEMDTLVNGTWGIHCESQDFCHFPLRHGFHYYYGMPLTNLQDCGGPDSGPSEIFSTERSFPTCSLFFPSLFSVLLITYSLRSPSYRKLLSFGASVYFTLWCIEVVPMLLFRQFNCILMRNYDVIEQPVRLESLNPKSDR